MHELFSTVRGASSQLAVTFVALLIAKRFYTYLQARNQNSSNLPFAFSAFSPVSLFGVAIRTTWWNLGLDFLWTRKGQLYQNAPFKTITVVPLLRGDATVYSSNTAVLQQVFGNNSDFFKPPMAIDDLKFLGANVVASEGETWKRHRRIAAPAFSQVTYENVWTTTASVHSEILEKEGWSNVQEVRVPDMNKITHKLALFIVAMVGFGIPMTWAEPMRNDQGKLSIQEMVFEVATTILIRSRTPRLMYSLGTSKLKRIDEAYNRFEELMYETIATREDEICKLRELPGSTEEDITDHIRDLLGRLVNAKFTDGKLALTDEEIIGNCFIMLFAGHETTANTLTATLALLALYPDIQNWVYSCIKDVLDDREPNFKDYDGLDAVLACFLEALRLYPAVIFIFREAKHDTSLAIPHRDHPDVVQQVPVKQGQLAFLDFVGMSYDPQTFPDPERFEPRRWIAKQHVGVDKNSIEDFVGFSYGPRNCLGQKFAKIEAVCFLTLLLRDWQVEVELKDGDTMHDWRRKFLKPSFLITTTFESVPLKFVRRSAC